MSVFDELSVSFENPATDAMGYDSVEGKLVCRRDGLELQFKEKDRAFRKNPILTARFSYLEVEAATFHDRWFQPKRLTFQTSAVEKLAEFPGGNVGKVDLFVCRESITQAKRVAGFIDYRKSEARLAESEARREERGNEI